MAVGLTVGLADYGTRRAENLLESLQFGPYAVVLLFALAVVLLRWNSLTGPLAGKETTIRNLLNERGIILTKIRPGATSTDGWSYKFVWVTTTPDSILETVRTAVEAAHQGFIVKNVRNLTSTEFMLPLYTFEFSFHSDTKLLHRHRAEIDITQGSGPKQS